MKTWDELTRMEKKTVMKNYREEWLEDNAIEMRQCPADTELLMSIRNDLLKSNNPHIVYDAVLESEPEELIRYY